MSIPDISVADQANTSVFSCKKRLAIVWLPYPNPSLSKLVSWDSSLIGVSPIDPLVADHVPQSSRPTYLIPWKTSQAMLQLES